jgi:hypothetical protein
VGVSKNTASASKPASNAAPTANASSAKTIRIQTIILPSLQLLLPLQMLLLHPLESVPGALPPLLHLPNPLLCLQIPLLPLSHTLPNLLISTHPSNHTPSIHTHTITHPRSPHRRSKVLSKQSIYKIIYKAIYKLLIHNFYNSRTRNSFYNNHSTKCLNS